MSRHWRPERSDWTIIDGAPRVQGRGALLVLGAMVVGVIACSVWQSWPARPVESGLSSEIEWNAVQAVPTRTPDAEDIEWQKRAGEPSSAPAVAGSAGEQGAAVEKMYVIDGDTFGIGKQHIRIAGIDAPEIHPARCAREAQLGLAATQKLKELLSSGTVTIGGSGYDKYGRELRQVSVNGVDVAQTMIAAELASSYEGKKRQSWC